MWNALRLLIAPLFGRRRFAAELDRQFDQSRKQAELGR